MARHILGKKDKETNGKKDKKRRKKASSSESSDDDVPEEPEVTQEEIEEQLQIQLSLKQRHLKLKSAVKYEDLTCAAGLHIGWGACIVIGFILGSFLLFYIFLSWSRGADLLSYCGEPCEPGITHDDGPVGDRR